MPTSEPRADDSGLALGLIAHARYACRHSGVCCSSDWEIPVEDALHARLARAIDDGDLRPRGGIGLVDRANLPAGTRSVLGRRSGRCVFHTAGPCGCGLHAWGGADAKPVACRQFPWIAVHDPRGTFASLSHVCPAAQDRLVDPALLVLAPLPRAAASLRRPRRAPLAAAGPEHAPAARLGRAVGVGDAGARRVRAQRRAGGRAAGPAGAAHACAALDRDAGSARRVDRIVDPGRAAIGGCGMAAGSRARRDRPRVRTGGAGRAGADHVRRRCAPLAQRALR